MARLKIDDLPKDLEISQKEMKKIVGGRTLSSKDLSFTAGRFVSCEPSLVMTPSGPAIYVLYGGPS